MFETAPAYRIINCIAQTDAWYFKSYTDAKAVREGGDTNYITGSTWRVRDDEINEVRGPRSGACDEPAVGCPVLEGMGSSPEENADQGCQNQ